jgi:RNA polymerase sigma factor (TIGR02999 family)
MNDVTQILSRIEDGDGKAAEELLPLVYEELRKLAAQKMAQEKPGQTLQATALVHEAYLRLMDAATAQHWNSRRHFFLAAAEAMRRILVENSRRKRSEKAGGKMRRIDLDEAEATLALNPSPDDMLALDEGLAKLANVDTGAADVAKLRLFGGLTSEEAADQLGISHRTGFRHWAYARAFLRVELQGSEPRVPE